MIANHGAVSADFQCWLCGSHRILLKRTGIDPDELRPESFAITDSHDGLTLSIYACSAFGLLFCPGVRDVMRHYEALEDGAYEAVHEIFPQAALRSTYDAITLIDVLEHVSTPVRLLRDIAARLSAHGIAVVVTPDVASIAARVPGANWWHYRVAHIGYFGKTTLTAALKQAELQPIAWHRPVWFFPLDYLLSRLASYVPSIDRIIPARIAKSITVPLNLRDSWMVIAKKAATT